MDSPSESSWEQRRLQLLDKASRMKRNSVVDRAALLDLQTEIRELERRADRPLPSGATALRVFPSLQGERPSRIPVPIEHGKVARSCPLGRCDGSGWHLDDIEDVAGPCSCQRLPRDREARRQTKRILRRHLAPSLDSPALSLISNSSRDRLGAFTTDLKKRVDSGSGLWIVGAEATASAACALLAAEALRSEVATLLYPGDELIGRLRRLAVSGDGAVEREIYDRLASVEFLVIDGLDDAAKTDRFPEVRPPEAESGDDAEGEDGTHAIEYRPGMTVGDLARIAAVIDERLSNLKATVITTRSDSAWLEEELLHLPGEWPIRAESLPAWNEPRRRRDEARRLLSRLRGLGGEPVSLESRRGGGVRGKWDPGASDGRTAQSRAA
jgi:hypothetical protein